jgi:hypothetical protein
MLFGQKSGVDQAISRVASRKGLRYVQCVMSWGTRRSAVSSHSIRTPTQRLDNTLQILPPSQHNTQSPTSRNNVASLSIFFLETYLNSVCLCNRLGWSFGDFFGIQKSTPLPRSCSKATLRLSLEFPVVAGILFRLQWVVCKLKVGWRAKMPSLQVRLGESNHSNLHNLIISLCFLRPFHDGFS